jgi:hypothetical protein
MSCWDHFWSSRCSLLIQAPVYTTWSTPSTLLTQLSNHVSCAVTVFLVVVIIYTISPSDITNQLDGGSWTPLLSDKYFGSSDPETGRILDGTVLFQSVLEQSYDLKMNTGRWAYQAVPFVDADFYTKHGIGASSTFFPTEESAWKGSTHITNPYGFLPPTWNYNNDPYVTRYNALNLIASLGNVPSNERQYYNGVTCSEYESFVGKVKNMPMQDYLTYAEDDVHGIIHFTFGGISYAEVQLIIS